MMAMEGIPEDHSLLGSLSVTKLIESLHRRSAAVPEKVEMVDDFDTNNTLSNSSKLELIREIILQADTAKRTFWLSGFAKALQDLGTESNRRDRRMAQRDFRGALGLVYNDAWWQKIKMQIRWSLTKWTKADFLAASRQVNARDVDTGGISQIVEAGSSQPSSLGMPGFEARGGQVPRAMPRSSRADGMALGGSTNSSKDNTTASAQATAATAGNTLGSYEAPSKDYSA